MIFRIILLTLLSYNISCGKFGGVFQSKKVQNKQEVVDENLTQRNQETPIDITSAIENSKIEIDTNPNGANKIMGLLQDKLQGMKQENIEEINENVRQFEEENLNNFNDSFLKLFGKLQETNANNSQQNCIFFQEMMKGMPSQKKKWTKKVKDFFSFNKRSNLKSYRTLGVEMIKNYLKSPQEQVELNELLEKYRISKAIYHDNYMTEHNSDFEVETDLIEKLEKEQTNLKTKLETSEEKIKNMNIHLNEKLNSLKSITDFFNEQDIKQLNKAMSDYEEMINEVENATEAINVDKFKNYMPKGSTIYVIVNNFDNKHQELTRWENMKGAILEHIKILKKEVEINPGSDKKDLLTELNSKNYIGDIEKVLNTLGNQGKEIKKSLLENLRIQINTKFNNPEKYDQIIKLRKDYKNLIKTAANMKIEMKSEEENRDNLRYKIEQLIFQMQKLNFNNNYDYVFPSGLIIGLQLKEKRLSNLLIGLKEKTEVSYFDPSDETLNFNEQDISCLNDFFTSEKNNMEKTHIRLQAQIELALEIDIIEAQIDTKLGEYLGRAHLVVEGKTCFSLGEISYFIFTMVKTNVIVKEIDFFKGFFSQLSEIMVKEFIIYNYMLLTQEEYVDEVIKQSHDNFTEQKMVKTEIFDKELVKNFVSNYVLVVGFYRDMTDFGRGEGTPKKQTNSLCRSIIAMAMTFVQGKLMENYEDQVKTIIDTVSIIIVVAVPFLHFIPFSKKIVSFLLNFIVGKILQMLSAIASLAFTYYNESQQNKNKKKLQEEQEKKFMFNVNSEIEQIVKAKRGQGVQFHMDSNSNIDLLEQSFLKVLNDEDNVFNKLETLHIYRDSDLDANRAAVFELESI